jgi:hypothetical protein
MRAFLFSVAVLTLSPALGGELNSSYSRGNNEGFLDSYVGPAVPGSEFVPPPAPYGVNPRDWERGYDDGSSEGTMLKSRERTSSDNE